MAGLRFSALQKRPMELLDLTSVTLGRLKVASAARFSCPGCGPRKNSLFNISGH